MKVGRRLRAGGVTLQFYRVWRAVHRLGMGMVADVRFVGLQRVVEDGADRRVAADRFHARSERARARRDVREVAAGGGSSLIDGAPAAVEKRAAAVLGAQDLVIRIAGLRIDVLPHYFLHRDAQVRGDDFNLCRSQFDDHAAAAVRASRAVDLALDLVSKNLERLDGHVMGMEVAAEVEVLRFLQLCQTADLVGISNQVST